MAARLYVVPSSHPCWAVKRALELKRVDYRRIEWPPPLQVPMQRLIFGRRTVPGLSVDGERVVGSRAIMRRLDELHPEPPLYPADPGARRLVEESELWGDEVLQSLARRLIWWGLGRAPGALPAYAEDSAFPLPDFAIRASAPLLWRAEWRMNDVGDARCERDLEELPGHLDLVDGWIAEGRLGGEQPNAADLQIGSSIALLNTIADLRPLLEGRVGLALALREFGGFPGHLPAGTLPAPRPVTA
jgi:glutathione S-transferase